MVDLRFVIGHPKWDKLVESKIANQKLKIP